MASLRSRPFSAWIIPLALATCALAVADDHIDPDLDRQLKLPIGLVFENIDLREVLDFIEENYDVEFEVDVEAIEERDEKAGRARSSLMVSKIDIRRTPLSQAIGRIVKGQQLDFLVDYDYIWISTPEEVRLAREEYGRGLTQRHCGGNRGRTARLSHQAVHALNIRPRK